MLYFAYGSNLNLEQMLQRCEAAQPLSRAMLRGYKIVYRRRVATIEPGEETDCVYGAVYSIQPSDREALDFYEGYPVLYRRISVTVEAPGLGSIDTMTYQMSPRYRIAPPTESYYRTIEQGYADWTLPLEELEETIEEVYNEA